MKALAAKTYGDFRNVLKLRDVPDPAALSKTELLVKVAYSDLNPVDLQKLSSGSGNKAGQPVDGSIFIPGYSGSGIVAKSNDDEFPVGTRVVFLLNPQQQRSGSYAEYCKVDVRACAKVPDAISLRDAATVPLAGCTAHECLARLNIQHKRRLLIVGGAGGVGSWAISLAKLYNPNLDIVVATRDVANATLWCIKLGASNVVSSSNNNCSLMDSLGGGGIQGSVDAILCLVEATESLFEQLSQVIQPYGSICLVVGGDAIKKVDASFLFFKSVTLHFETVFSCFRTNFAHFQPAQEMQEILEMIETSRMAVPLTPLPYEDDWNEFTSALKILSSGHSRGKMVLCVAGEDVQL